jgi:hypothetical protein
MDDKQYLKWLIPVVFLLIALGIYKALSDTRYRVRDIKTNATMIVSGDKGLEVGDTVWVKQGDIVEIDVVNNEDPWVRPCIIK